MQEHPWEQDNGMPDITEVVSEFGGKSEAELFSVLREATEAERAAGNLDNTRMDEIYETISPFLTDAQRAKMREVLARLKA